ncbi:hypothetical protein [Catellatospora citrea]|uniref:Uncharacterized protein n=1 Tax=Catellatospora citrea TaxID=53366 RepID=A0A8J3P2Q8_9ACTN|nr:hypothetical protein [Catellatospora citrea]RKE08558.1 hypothetical protein C8E86_3410 [Catellatospora citrea]GIG01713.1 hypothetical protein Cci01nite_68060 [Catellatospora citrea]
MSESTPNPYDAGGPLPAEQGFRPPDEAYREAMPDFGAEHDPLVNPEVQGFSGWSFRVGGVLRRGWQQLLVIFALSHLLPTVVFGALALAGVVASGGIDLAGLGRNGTGEELIAALGATAAAYVVVVLILQMLGYAAATHLATRQAAGLPVTVGEAMRYGLRRMLGLAAWQVLAYLLVGLGVVAVAACCVQIASLLGLIPVLLVVTYLMMVIALVGPAFLFERSGPLRRSSTLLHAAFWPTAGRLLLLGLTLAAGSVIDQVAGGIVTALVPAGDDAMAVAVGGGATLLTAVIEIPLTMVLFSGILITYAERRGAEGPVSTRQLVEELAR